MSSVVSDRYLCGGTSKLSGAGLFLKTRPAKSNVDPWQAHRKPPDQSSGSEGCGPGVNLSDGEQPRCVQIPTATITSGLRLRYTFLAYSGVNSLGLRSDFGSANRVSSLARASSCSGVRLIIQTGFPRHSTVSFSPGRNELISTSTGAPAARARSEGWKVLTKGTATAAPPTTPAHPDAISQVRLPLSTCWLLIGKPLKKLKSGSNPTFY